MAIDAKAVIEHFGGVSATARAFGCTPPSVSGWVTKRFPPCREWQLEALSGGKWMATRPEPPPPKAPRKKPKKRRRKLRPASPWTARR
jgi:hypothetical protein